MRITIVTPSYNQGKFIRQTLENVLVNQDYKDIEHLVIDGGSSDETLEILKTYKARFPNELTYISEKDSGQSNAINKGFHKATGDIIGWINSDDYYEKNIFKYIVNYFIENPNVDMIYGICHVVDENGNFLMDGEDSHAFKKCNIDYKEFKYENLMDVYSGLIPQPAVFFRKKIFDKVGYLDESLNFVMDYEYWLRIGRVFQIRRVDKLLAYFRTHREAKTTFRNRFGYIFESLKARQRNGGRIISRFHLYISYLAIKTLGRIFLTKLGFLKETNKNLQ